MPSIILCIFTFNIDHGLVLSGIYCRSVLHLSIIELKTNTLAYPVPTATQWLAAVSVTFDRKISQWFLFLFIFQPTLSMFINKDTCSVLSYYIWGFFYASVSKLMRLHFGNWTAAVRLERSKVMGHVQVLEMQYVGMIIEIHLLSLIQKLSESGFE